MQKPLAFLGTYTAIHKGILERVLCKGLLTEYESRIFFAIAKESWGYQKPWCHSSYRDIADATSIPLRHVYNTAKSMHMKNIIAIGNGRSKTRFEINRDYMCWQLPKEGNAALLPDVTPGVTSTRNTPAPETVDPVEVRAFVRKFIESV